MKGERQREEDERERESWARSDWECCSVPWEGEA